MEVNVWQFKHVTNTMYNLKITAKNGKIYYKKVSTLEQATFEARLIEQSQFGHEIESYHVIPIETNAEEIYRQVEALLKELVYERVPETVNSSQHNFEGSNSETAPAVLPENLDTDKKTGDDIKIMKELMPTADMSRKANIKTEVNESALIPTRWYYNSGKTKKYIPQHQLENKFGKWKDNTFSPPFTRNRAIKKEKEKSNIPNVQKN